MGHCPNQFCKRNGSSLKMQVGESDLQQAAAEAVVSDVTTGGGAPNVAPNVAEYSTLVWIYVWPNTEYDEHAKMQGSSSSSSIGRDAVDSRAALSERLSDLKYLFESGEITEEEHVLARRSALGIARNE
jgi:hypothetical protein